MELSLIIPAHKSKVSLFKLIESILAQKNAPSYETIIVANPPQPDLKKHFSIDKNNFYYLETDIIGVNHARNLGLKAAQGQIVIFIDDDCFLNDSEFLKKHFDKHRKNPHLDGLGGLYSLPNHSTFVERAYHAKQLEWVRDGLRPGYHADLLFGGNMSFKKKSISGIFFDEKIKFGGAETEFIFHLASKGKKINIFEEPTLQHQTKMHWKDFLKKASLQGSGAAYLKQKNYQIDNIILLNKKTNKSATELPIKIMLFFYEIFFLAGFFLKEKDFRFNKFNIFLAANFIFFEKIMLQIKHYFFVDLWCAIEAALFSMRDKPRSKDKTKAE